jgi:1-acyl-sn-glycerol-3-phosphate acyltransferase
MRRIRDWLVSIPTVIGFGLTLGVYDLVGRAALLLGLRPFEYVMAALQRTLVAVFSIAGTKVQVERHPGIKPHTGYALISNHQSMFDIVLIGGLLFTNFPKYVAKKELGRRIPSVSLNLRRGGNCLIDRDDRRQALRAISEMAETAQERNVSVVIFPEGTRSRDGSLGEFRPAGSKVLLRSANDLPVVPVAVDGSWRLFANNLLPVPFGTTVRISFGEPLDREPGDEDDKVAAARAWIDGTLEGWRS